MVLPFLFLQALASPAPPAPEEPAGAGWLSLDGPVVVLNLVHQHPPRRLDGGVLRIDPGRGTVSWAGIPGELGCRESFEAPFSGVKKVAPRPPGGFVVDVAGRGEFTFTPAPHALWLQEAPGGDGGLEARRPTRAPRPRGAGPPPGVPKNVAFDVRLAVESISDALGRSPAPGAALRNALYGEPEDVLLQDVADDPGSYEGLPVRVTGQIEAAPSGYSLTSGEARLPLSPAPEVAMLFAARVLAHPAELTSVTGVFRRVAGAGPGPAGPPSLLFWDFVPEGAPPETPAPDQVALEALLASPGQFEGATVHVMGKFRGRNLFFDLPALPGRPRSDFVIKGGSAAVWVTGKAPKGPGWRLDPTALKDTEQWVDVVGRAHWRDGVAFLRATSITLTVPSPSRAHVTRTRRLAGGAAIAPTIMFTLPLLGEDVARDARFVIQFSKYMDEKSFEGRVELRYVGGRSLGRTKLSYDDERRALVVDPGELLAQGRELEVVLRPGIRDSDGLALEEASAVLHYRVGS